MARRLHADSQDLAAPRQVASVSYEDVKFLQHYISAYGDGPLAHVIAIKMALESIGKDNEDFGYAHALFERVPANKILQLVLISDGFGLIKIAREIESVVSERDKKISLTGLKAMLDIFDVDQSIGVSGRTSGRMVDMNEIEAILAEWDDERLQSCIKER